MTILSRQYHPTSTFRAQQQEPPLRSDPKAHTNFYRTHGRALFKALTLAFLSFQVFYWCWLTVEAEYEKNGKEKEINGLEGEVRLLEESRNKTGS